MKITILRDIEAPGFSSIFFKRSSRIIYDTKSPKTKKLHQLLYQQGERYGEIGDMCTYLKHDELLDLERRGFVSIKRSTNKR